MSNPNPAPSAPPAPDANVEKLLSAANDASQSVAALHVAFMAFAAYFGVIIWGTTHEDLLRINPVKLPILDVEVPLTTFYGGVPWLLVLLHFNLLLQFELLSRKLWNLDGALPPGQAGQPLRDHLFIFPFTHLIAGGETIWLTRWLLAFVVGITVIALPQFNLLAAQISFLPYHDEGITWSQRLAVWVDAALIFTLWPLIASSEDRWGKWWQDAFREVVRGGYWLGCLPIRCWNGLATWLNQRNIRWQWPISHTPLNHWMGDDAKGKADFHP